MCVTCSKMCVTRYRMCYVQQNVWYTLQNVLGLCVANVCYLQQNVLHVEKCVTCTKICVICSKMCVMCSKMCVTCSEFNRGKIQAYVSKLKCMISCLCILYNLYYYKYDVPIFILYLLQQIFFVTLLIANHWFLVCIFNAFV